MGLHYSPSPGEVLLCNFPMQALGAEMIKPRPAIVVTPRRRRRRLVGIVPLSTTAPERVEKYHHLVRQLRALPAPFDAGEAWAKCDMYAVVALERLDRFRAPRPRYGGPRQWFSGSISPEDLHAVRIGVIAGLGFGKP